jgi:methanogenic corrinoid protein MtbC1
MVDLLGRGLSASDAARVVLEGGAGMVAETPVGATPLQELERRLHAAFRGFDEAELEAAIDAALASVDLDTSARELFVPALRQIGDDWARGTVSVAQEHFAVHVLRARLLALARGWDQGFGPRVLLACPEDELHDVSLVLFGLLMRRRGWRVTFLGADTPLEDVLATQERLSPEFTVVYSTAWAEHEQFAGAMSARATRPFALAGATAAHVAEETGCRALAGDPVSAAAELTAEFAPRGRRAR